MTANTSKYLIPYPQGTDLVAGGENAMQAIAELVDLLLGETNTETITPTVANTTVSKRVNYARTYAALPTVPVVMLSNHATIASTDGVYFWVTGEDATGFTLNCRAQTLTVKTVRWSCKARG